jgi:CYTH domain-containing protein
VVVASAPDSEPRPTGTTPPRGVEIERKFLVRRLPEDLARHPHESVTQGYLVIGDDGFEVRIRRTRAATVLTIKAGRGTVRLEEEVPISAATFASLWPLTEGRRVEKVRYRVPHADAVIEVDVFDGSLRGLVTAEVEFASALEGERFEPPDWLGHDISQERGYKNQELAMHGAPGHTQGEEPR